MWDQIIISDNRMADAIRILPLYEIAHHKDEDHDKLESSIVKFAATDALLGNDTLLIYN